MAKASLKTKINYQNSPKKNQQKQGFSLGVPHFLNPSPPFSSNGISKEESEMIASM